MFAAARVLALLLVCTTSAMEGERANEKEIREWLADPAHRACCSMTAAFAFPSRASSSTRYSSSSDSCECMPQSRALDAATFASEMRRTRAWTSRACASDRP
ncbi:hypothetical protein M885DRAFT_532351 [Pelagophyceae sp. CCMP2097]|nr:hypothetical protein M885DRAFT_532351 [Pelagophyceae sp. CCMP2097]